MKEVYIDSRGGEHIIADMPRILVFNVVMKHGKEKLLDQGYDMLVERFTNIIKNAGIIKLINEMEVEI